MYRENAENFELDSEEESFSSSEENISNFSNNLSDSESNYLSENESDTSSESEYYVTDNDLNGLIRFFYTNADNLMNKLDELRVRASDSNFDVMVITEVYPKFGDSREILPAELQKMV